MTHLRTTIDSDFLPVVINAFPAPIFIVDRDVWISAINDAAAAMQMRGGEALHCVHATETHGGCGRSASCKDCVIRNSVTKTFARHKVSRFPTKMQRRGPAGS